MAGTWKDKPVANIKTAIKSKYWSKDQNGSTTSEPYEIKNFNAAGTKKKQEKIKPQKNRIPEPKLTGSIILRSVFVKPGIKYSKS